MEKTTIISLSETELNRLIGVVDYAKRKLQEQQESTHSGVDRLLLADHIIFCEQTHANLSEYKRSLVQPDYAPRVLQPEA